jgi:hypothetical protein
MSVTSNYALRLLASTKEAAEQIAKEEGTTLNQFINVAVTEKISAIRTEQYLRERAQRGDMKDFWEFLEGPEGGGETPRAGDERGSASAPARSRRGSGATRTRRRSKRS